MEITTGGLNPDENNLLDGVTNLVVSRAADLTDQRFRKTRVDSLDIPEKSRILVCIFFKY